MRWVPRSTETYVTKPPSQTLTIKESPKTLRLLPPVELSKHLARRGGVTTRATRIIAAIGK
jgi:hypothetical protein